MLNSKKLSKMKNIKISIIWALLLGIVLINPACTDLNEQAYSILPADQYTPQTEEDIYRLISPAYGELREVYLHGKVILILRRNALMKLLTRVAQTDGLMVVFIVTCIIIFGPVNKAILVICGAAVMPV
jgi:hypothetical protein